eukprot:scaffold628134_cov52-Prasinocladus_malaysianus.AAC.1
MSSPNMQSCIALVRVTNLSQASLLDHTLPSPRAAAVLANGLLIVLDDVVGHVPAVLGKGGAQLGIEGR